MVHIKRSKIVVWCVESASARLIDETAGKSFQIVWARDAANLATALRHEEGPAAVLIDNTSAQNVAIECLQNVRSALPQARRILLTDYCDLGIIVKGLHTQAVQKIVYKPIHGPELLSVLGAPSHAVMIPAQSSTARSFARAS